MRSRALSLAVLAAVAFACGWQGGAPSGAATERLSVVATTSIVADLVRSVAAGRVTVDQLMGPGVDPHLYKPSAGDVRRLASARTIFYSGLHLEGKMSELFAEMGRRGTPTVAVAECVPADRLIHPAGSPGVHDPHVWFDVSLWLEAVDCVRAALAELDPDGGPLFAERARAYRDELLALDRWVRNRVAEVPPEHRVLVTAHDAFAYFGRAYGLEVRGLLGVNTTAEAGTSDVQQLADFVAERRVPAVFVETSVPPRFVEALQEAVAARGFAVSIGGALYSDALGNPGTPAGTYVGTVRTNVDTIVGALTSNGDTGP